MTRPTLPAVGSVVHREFRLEGVTDTDSNALPRSTLSTGEEIRIGPGLVQVLEHSEDAVDFERASRGLALMVVHGDGGGALPVGRVENVALEDGVLRGDPVLSEATEYTRDVMALIRDGTIRDLSIGARVDRAPVYEEREGEPDLIRIPRWTPMEVSLAAVGVDGGAGIARAFTQESMTMSDEDTRPARGAGPRPLEDDPETIRRAALAQARDIFIEGYPTLADRAGELLTRASMPGQSTTAEQFGAELLELANGQDGETIRRGGTITAGMDHAEKTMIGLERAFCVRTSNPLGDLVTRADGRQELREIDPAEPWANPFSGLDTGGLAREWLKACGVDPAGMSKSQMIERVMHPEHRPVIHIQRAVGGAAQNTTATFTHILENVLNKSLFRGFDEHPSTWQVWTQRGSQPDFKAFTRPGLSHYGDLAVVAENGEYLEVPMVDKKEGSALVKHGGRFSITWEALVDDDLSAFTEIGPSMGRSGARLVDSLPYALIIANPTMTEDGFTLFNSTDVGRTGTQANLGTEALAEGAINNVRVSMVRKVDQNSVKIMPQLTYLLAPPELTETGEKLLRGSSIPNTDGAQEHNTVQGRYTWVESAWLQDGTDWYGAANTGTVEMHFLDGNERPTLRRESGFVRDVEWFRVRQVAVALAVDWRGLHKNVVAGG